MLHRRAAPGDTDVAGGITDSAGTVTSAAVMMASVFAVFVLGHGIEFKQVGVGMATAVLIDVLIVRAFVLPALLNKVGEKVWWPSRPTGVPPTVNRSAGRHRASPDGRP